MSKINLLIADIDVDYIESMYRFFMDMYSDRLNIIAYTDMNLLDKYLTDNSGKSDVLLISTDMISDWSLIKSKISGTMISLTSIRNMDRINGIPAICKYQSGDKIISDIFGHFSENSEQEININDGKCNAKVFAVYSPIGGSGKSSVAIAISKILSGHASKVFYLNLETVATTFSFLDCSSKYSLSNIFYSIKEKSRNLPLKIEAAKNIDISSGVNFFAPAESALEIEEMLPEEIIILVEQLKLLGQYDYIIIDMSSSLNKTNLELLKNSDQILTVMLNDKLSQDKLNILLREYEILSQRENINLLNKSVFLLNKCLNHSPINSPANSDTNISQNIDLSITIPNVDINGVNQVIDIIMADVNLKKLITSLIGDGI